VKGKREITGWVMYDFANSAFATTISAVIFNKYFATVVAGGEKGVDIFGIHLHGAAFFTFTVSIAMTLVAISAPLLGAIADYSQSKRRFLILYCYTGVLFTGLLYFIHEGDYWIGAFFFIMASLGFSGGNVFYNAFLPEIASPRIIGRISGWGFTLGYLGGGLLLVINLIMLNYPTWIGFPEGTFTVHHTFLSVSIWWGLFSLPTFLWVKDRKVAQASLPVNMGPLLKIGWQRVFQTMKKINSYRELKKFLFAFLLYNDGIQTVIIVASIFGAEILKMNTGELIFYFLVIQGTAFWGSLLFGYLADWMGKKKTILLTLWIWMLVVVWAYRLGIFWDPKTEYWILGILAGIVLGGSQSASRALAASLIPEGHTAEFFGFFAIAHKFASIFGPLVYGVILSLTGSLQNAILSLVLFFGLGIFLLMRVDEKKATTQISAENA
jgi:UMF1 family MFS transporter